MMSNYFIICMVIIISLIWLSVKLLLLFLLLNAEEDKYKCVVY